MLLKVLRRTWNETMNLVWIVDDDEEMGRAVSLMLKLLDYEAKYFFQSATCRASPARRRKT